LKILDPLSTKMILDYMDNNKYQKHLKKSNTIFLDGNTIRLYKNSIEIYLGHSFFGKTTNEAENKSLSYLQRFLTRLEHDLDIMIIKNRARNIKIVNQHYARGDSEICDNAHKNKKRVWVYAEEDDKLCFITDDSFGLREDETLHPTTSKKDRKAIDKQVNDWRLNNPPTNSQLATHIMNLTQNLELYGKHIVTHTKSIISLSKAIPQLVNILKETKKENKMLKQRRLSEWTK
jgi:hypothetical protein